MASIAFLTRMPSRPEPRRTRVAQIRARAEFLPAVLWTYACALGLEGTSIDLDAVPAAVRARVEEQVVRAARALDPIALSVARQRAMEIAKDHVDVILACRDCTPEKLIERVAHLVDTVLAVHEAHLTRGEWE